MFSKYLIKALDDLLKKTGKLQELEELYVKSLGTPPDIDKKGNLKELPKPTNMEVIDKLVRYNSTKNLLLRK